MSHPTNGMGEASPTDSEIRRLWNESSRATKDGSDEATLLHFTRQLLRTYGVEASDKGKT